MVRIKIQICTDTISHCRIDYATKKILFVAVIQWSSNEVKDLDLSRLVAHFRQSNGFKWPHVKAGNFLLQNVDRDQTLLLAPS